MDEREVIREPGAVPGHCPSCGEASLTPQSLGDGTPTQFCTSCKGFALDLGALLRHVGASDRDMLFLASVARQSPTQLPCYRCANVTLQAVVLAIKPNEVGPTVYHCPACAGAWIVPGTLGTIKKAFADARTSKSITPLPEGPLAGERLDFDTPWVALLALPIVFLLAYLIQRTSFGIILQAFFINMWLHELGHAAVAWLSGHLAVPLPFFTIPFTDSRSVIMIALVFGALGVGLWAGLREKRPYISYVCGAIMTVAAIMTALLPRELALKWIIFGGCAGEFVLGTLLVVSFYYPMPDRIRWDFWRFLAAFVGAFSYVAALTLWYRSHVDLRRLPWGSAMGGGKDRDGDINRLVYHYDFSAQEVADTYFYLGLFCLLVILAHYAFFLQRAMKRNPEVVQQWRDWIRQRRG